MYKFLKSVRLDRLSGTLACGLLLLLSGAVSAEQTTVYWSGFAYQGDFAAGEGRYPITTGLLEVDDNGVSNLDQALRARVKRVTNDTFVIEPDQYGQLGPDTASSVALAFVLDRETVSVERFGKEFKLLVELSAQALFFDFREMSVLASYPLTLQYVDVLSRTPTDADAHDVIRRLYFGGLPVNVIDEFADALQDATLNIGVSRRLQVTGVSVGLEAVDKLPAHLRDNVNDFKASLATEFSRALTANQNVPVLPYTKGYAIGNVMSMRFADQTVYNLEIPEPDYEIQLDLKKLVKIEYGDVPAGKSYIYGSYVNVQLTEPLSARTYLNKTVKNGATKVVPATQTSVDDWPAYQDSILGLISQFTKSLTRPTRDWAKKHIGEESAVDEILAFSQVVSSCR